MGAAREVLRRLERAPVRAQVKDDKTGETVTVVLGKEDFQRDFVDGGPRSLISIYHEQYVDWARTVLARRRSREAELLLIGSLIDTSLGVTPRREFLLRTDAGTEFLGLWGFNHLLAAADIWPTSDVGDEFRTEVVSQIPVVFAQGDWDTQTPIENLLQVSPYFPNSRTLIAVQGFHGVLEPLAAQLPEVFAILLEFVETGSAAKLPARVTMPIGTFASPKFPLPVSKPRP